MDLFPSSNSIKINTTGCFDLATETSHMGQSYSQADFFLMESPFLHSNMISMHILHTVLYTFPKVLTRRTCLAIMSFSSW